MSNIEDIENVRSFLFEFKDGTELRLVEKENYDKLVERIKELEAKLEEANKQLDLDYVDKNYIPKQKVKEILDKAELMDYYTLPNVIEDLEKIVKERSLKMQILHYCLELDNIKENELPEKDTEKITEFNNSLADKYGLCDINVLENNNLYFRGRITSKTKTENNSKLKLLIAELNNFYKKYGLKKIIKDIIAYGHTLYL